LAVEVAELAFQRVATEIGGEELIIESGEVAKQASGSVVVRLGETMVLGTVTMEWQPGRVVDFVPLTVDYREKAYSAGRIPGSFFRREGRPTERETVVTRMTDRPLRPFFPKGFRHETQIICTVLSFDQRNDPDIPAMVAASAALAISEVPVTEIVAAVKVGRVDGQLVINPTHELMENSDLNLVMACTRDALVMVEASAKEVSESTVVDALWFGHEQAQKVVDVIGQLRGLCGKPKMAFEAREVDESLKGQVEAKVAERIRQAITIPEKQKRESRLEELSSEVLAELPEDGEELQADVKSVLEEVERREMRSMILQRGVRSDGRGMEEIRPITSRVGVLPRTHGSALFTRGETQALVVSTLGTSLDEQRLDDIEGRTTKAFMLHYNFPPYSVGEVRRIMGPGRREIGHGALAARALLPVLPSSEEFPYTIRIVSDILESNGSSSMATVCGATMAVMDAGVPISAPVAGIAMGLIKEDEIAILSDILGIEDHLGDMDFKVAGTATGITALQMDIKMAGITREIMERALEQARQGRLFILDKMLETIDKPREDLSDYAPRIFTMKVKSEKVRDVIGPGGRVIRGITEKTGCTIDIEDDGTIKIVGVDQAALRQAADIISEITREAEIGKYYMGVVKRIMDFGAFVEIFPGTEGLVHISQMAPHRVRRVSDEVKEGDRILVKVTDIDANGKVRLSRKDAMKRKPESE